MSFSDGEVGTATQPRSTLGVAEVSHAAIREQLSEYLEGTLAQPARDQLDEHLRRCRTCRSLLSTINATKRALGRLPQEKAPPGAKQRLLDIPQSQ